MARKKVDNSDVSLKVQRISAFALGIATIIASITIAILIPSPTESQYIVFRIVLATAIGGVASMIPGFLEVEVKPHLRAGGALGAFTLVFLFNPAQLIGAHPLTAKITISSKDGVNIEAEGIKPTSEVGGELKTTSDGWEFVIPTTSVPKSKKLTFKAVDKYGVVRGTISEIVEDGQVHGDIPITKRAGGVVFGVVKSGDKCLSGAKVFIMGLDSASTTTDENGKFKLQSQESNGAMVQLHAEKEHFITAEKDAMVGSLYIFELEPDSAH